MIDTHTAIKLANGDVKPKDDKELLEAYQHLLDTGLVWTLHGHYGRTARYMINEGLIEEKFVD
jgi:hypothetical protein